MTKKITATDVIDHVTAARQSIKDCGTAINKANKRIDAIASELEDLDNSMIEIKTRAEFDEKFDADAALTIHSGKVTALRIEERKLENEINKLEAEIDKHSNLLVADRAYNTAKGMAPMAFGFPMEDAPVMFAQCCSSIGQMAQNSLEWGKPYYERLVAKVAGVRSKMELEEAVHGVADEQGFGYEDQDQRRLDIEEEKREALMALAARARMDYDEARGMYDPERHGQFFPKFVNQTSQAISERVQKREIEKQKEWLAKQEQVRAAASKVADRFSGGSAMDMIAKVEKATANRDKLKAAAS